MGLCANGKLINPVISGKITEGMAKGGSYIYKKSTELVHIYGVKRQISSSDPAWERTDDAIGLIANATHDGSVVQNDFDSLYPWSGIISYNYDNDSKTITAYYGDETFSFDGSNGSVLTKIPEFWYKREQKDGYEYQYIADGKVEGFIKSEEFSVGRYISSAVNAETGTDFIPQSISGVAPKTHTSRAMHRDNIRKYFGDGWCQLDWRYCLLEMLYLVEYADYNSQKILGYGSAKNDAGPISSGGCDALGMKSGCLINDKKHSVIYRGIEDIYGNMYQWIDGININYLRPYICYDPTQYADMVTTGSYVPLGYTTANNTSGVGFAKELGYDANHPLFAFPTSIGGDGSTYVTDYYFIIVDTKRATSVGGYFGNSNEYISGLWQWTFEFAVEDAYWGLGGRLIKFS